LEIGKHYKNNRPLGFAFIIFTEVKSAHDVIKTENHDVCGKIVSCKKKLVKTQIEEKKIEKKQSKIAKKKAEKRKKKEEILRMKIIEEVKNENAESHCRLDQEKSSGNSDDKDSISLSSTSNPDLSVINEMIYTYTHPNPYNQTYIASPPHILPSSVYSMPPCTTHQYYYGGAPMLPNPFYQAQGVQGYQYIPNYAQDGYPSQYAPIYYGGHQQGWNGSPNYHQQFRQI